MAKLRLGLAGTLLAAALPVLAQETKAPPIQVVLFTHIEDNTPAGVLGTPTSRTSYLNLRTRLVDLGTLLRLRGVPWSFQPDWKFLLAAQQYETPDVMASTGGVNVLRHLRDVLGVRIDPHSHENGGYNYTDVSHLLETLGVGGSTVIGGHVWDPMLPQFQGWDRFREPVPGEHFPTVLWRGDILMGSGTPNHVNDPIVSGVWRPRDRDHYFEDDPAGNIVSVGAFRGDLPGIAELVELRHSGQVKPGCLLTASNHIKPADITAPNGIAAIEASLIGPLAALRASGEIALTDFTALAAAWREQYGARACLYDLTPGH